MWGESKQSRALLRKKKSLAVAASGCSGSSERCGDSHGWTRLGDGRYAIVISDGTGKGELAAKESGRAVNAVLGLLKAGTDPEMTLQILNLILTMDNRKERFPTMDMALLDPGNRELYIYKIGAAPTAIKRTTGSVEILTAPAMPMGIMEYDRIPCVSTMVSAGDQIIMMTDGIVDSVRRDLQLEWLQRLLVRIKSRSSRTVCDLVLREASLNYGTREKDDMTVVVFQVP